MKTLLLIVALSITANAQLSQDESDVMANLLLFQLSATRCGMLSNAPDECKKLNAELPSIYLKIARSPKLTAAYTSEAIAKYQTMANVPGNKSAMQISQIVDQQNAQLVPLIVFQNQRIIELLEAILKKPR